MARQLRLFVSEKLSDRNFPLDWELSDSDAHHYFQVLRQSIGATVWVADAAGDTFRGQLHKAPDEAGPGQVRIHERIDAHQKGLKPAVQIYMAPLRAGRMDKWLKPLAELGASEFVPVMTERGVMRFGDQEKAISSKIRRWQTIAMESAKQSGRAIPMHIADPMDLQACLAERAHLSQGLMLDPLGQALEVSQWQELRSGTKPLGLLIGPEGGFSQAERDLALKNDWKIIRFHDHTLRAETAAISAMAIVQFMISS